MELFTFSMNPLELVVRGTLIYLGLVLVLRFVLRRDVGSLGVADILFIVLIADAAQNAIAGDYRTLADGAVLIGTLVAWNVVLDWGSYKWAWLRKITEPPAVPLIRRGRWITKNMQREWLSREEIESKLREKGIDDLADVRLASLEPDGELAVLRVSRGQTDSPRKKVVV